MTRPENSDERPVMRTIGEKKTPPTPEQDDTSTSSPRCRSNRSPLPSDGHLTRYGTFRQEKGMPNGLRRPTQSDAGRATAAEGSGMAEPERAGDSKRVT